MRIQNYTRYVYTYLFDKDKILQQFRRMNTNF